MHLWSFCLWLTELPSYYSDMMWFSWTRKELTDFFALSAIFLLQQRRLFSISVGSVCLSVCLFLCCQDIWKSYGQIVAFSESLLLGQRTVTNHFTSLFPGQPGNYWQEWSNILNLTVSTAFFQDTPGGQDQCTLSSLSSQMTWSIFSIYYELAHVSFLQISHICINCFFQVLLDLPLWLMSSTQPRKPHTYYYFPLFWETKKTCEWSRS